MKNKTVKKPVENTKYYTDTELINKHFGGFLAFLRTNKIPTPNRAELRILLYSDLLLEYTRQIAEYVATQKNNAVAKTDD